MPRPAGSDVFVQSSQPRAQQWTIMAARLPAGTGTRMAELFIDSASPIAPEAVTITGDTDSGPLSIGSERVGGSEHFDGDLARILVHDRPLSSAELGETGQALAALYGIATEF